MYRRETHSGFTAAFELWRPKSVPQNREYNVVSKGSQKYTCIIRKTEYSYNRMKQWALAVKLIGQLFRCFKYTVIEGFG